MSPCPTMMTRTIAHLAVMSPSREPSSSSRGSLSSSSAYYNYSIIIPPYYDWRRSPEQDTTTFFRILSVLFVFFSPYFTAVILLLSSYTITTLVLQVVVTTTIITTPPFIDAKSHPLLINPFPSPDSSSSSSMKELWPLLHLTFISYTFIHYSLFTSWFLVNSHNSFIIIKRKK